MNVFFKRAGSIMLIRTDEVVDLETPSGPMRVHVSIPLNEGTYPAIILYSEIYQVTAPIQRLAAMIAGQGYMVVTPEIYHEYEPAGRVLPYDKDGTDRGNELKYTKTIQSFDDDTESLLEWLDNNPNCSGSIGSFGVCLGGHLSYRAALFSKVKSAACFYATDIHSATLGFGKNDNSLERASDLKGELMMVWGRSDPHVPYAGRRKIRDALEEAGARVEWHEVDGQHAFLRDSAPRFDAVLFLNCMALTNSFFQKTLR